jgi:hypothetical protein
MPFVSKIFFSGKMRFENFLGGVFCLLKIVSTRSFETEHAPQMRLESGLASVWGTSCQPISAR